MKEIVLTRIDDRLIHGQVVTAWLKHITADAILIVDNNLAKNTMMARIYKAAAPSDIELVIKEMAEAIDYLKADDRQIQTIFLLVKTPDIVETLKTAGITIPHIILGGMGSNNERTQLIKNVFASPEERKSMRRLLDSATTISYQLVPDDKAVKIRQDFLEKAQ